MNAWDTMRAAMDEARTTLSAADRQVAHMASMLRGRLRLCDARDLKALKRELRAFNIHTGEWKE